MQTQQPQPVIVIWHVPKLSEIRPQDTLGGHITLLVFRGGGQSPTRKLRSNLRSRCRTNSTTAARPRAATAAVMQPVGVPAHIAPARWDR